MEFLLISNVDDSRLFTLNALTNSILSFFKEKVPVISLVLISESKVDDNFLFLKERYLDVDYISRFNQLKKLKKKEYDYLISIDHSLLGLALGFKTKAVSKVCFKGWFTYLIFNINIPQIKKVGQKHINLADIRNLMELTFAYSEGITPKYHLENPLVRKNHEMIHWIYNTNHAIDLPNSTYILIDIEIDTLQRNKQLEMVSNLCDHLIKKFKLKIIFITDQVDLFEYVMNSSTALTANNFINSKQSIDNAIAYFPLLNHSSLIITNKLKITPFLGLIEKPCYLIKHKRILSRLYSLTSYYKNLSKKTIGEISYMLKSI